MKFPILSTTGLLTDPNMILIQLFQYFIIADKSQTHFFKKAKSLKWLLAEYEVGQELEEIIKQELEDLYGRYYDEVTVSVSLSDIENNNLFTTNIGIDCIKDKKTYRLDTALRITNNNVELILENIIKSTRK